METVSPIDPAVLTLTGQLPFIIILAAVLAYPISLFILWLYRRAIIRLMNQQIINLEQVHQQQASLPTYTGAGGTPPLLKLVTISSDTSSTPKKFTTLSQTIMKRSWQASVIYGLAGSVFTLIMMVVWLFSTGIEFEFFRCLMIFWVMAWPIVLTINLIAAATKRMLFLSSGLYFGIFFLLAITALIRNPDQTLFQLVKLWFEFNLAPSLLILIFLNRQIRAVGPMVLVFLMVALFGSVIITELVGRNENLLYILVRATSAIGVGDHAFLLMLIIGFCAFSTLGWLLVIWIRKSYATKKLTDQTVVLDSIWIIFGVTHSISLAFEDIAWTLFFFVAFLFYKIVVKAGFYVVGYETTNTKLLILRVFKLGKRSERIFDAITKYWRYGGSVQFIAGPDLATSTIKPHGFLAFLSRKLALLFIHSKSELDQRLNSMDLLPDFDGRFRINDFFCFDNTWEMAISKLIQQSDVILMDLRSFSPERKGCIQEIYELINTIPIDRIVLLIDDTTDSNFLKQTIQQCWHAMTIHSPNARDNTTKELRLFYINPSQDIPINALINELSMVT